jgi:dCMP deaminase
MTNWDERYIDLAKHISTWSKDPSTKVGAVIVGDRRRVISMGYNGFPRGVDDSEDRYNDRETKYKFVSHAERNALDNCNESVVDATLYVYPLPPCPECCKSIIQKGISRIVYTKNVNTHWHESFDSVSKPMLAEAGITCEEIEV